MNLYNLRRGFSLIELMTVIVILGILASVAMPAYKDYVYSAKLADGYVGIEAISKAQKIYFQDKHYFLWGGAAPQYYMDSSPPYGGKRVTIFTPTHDPHWGLYDDWKALREPIADGSVSYFGFYVAAGGWDNTSSPYYSHADSSGEPSLDFGSSMDSLPIARKISNDAMDSDVGVCDSGINGAQLGITRQANRNAALISAAAPLKGVANQCTFIVQALIADDDNIQANAIVSIRE